MKIIIILENLKRLRLHRVIKLFHNKYVVKMMSGGLAYLTLISLTSRWYPEKATTGDSCKWINCYYWVNWLGKLAKCSLESSMLYAGRNHGEWINFKGLHIEIYPGQLCSVSNHIDDRFMEEPVMPWVWKCRESGLQRLEPSLNFISAVPWNSIPGMRYVLIGDCML